MHLVGAMRHLVLASCLAAACAGPRPQLASHPKGYAEHMAAADAHDERADEHRQAGHVPDSQRTSGAGYQCGDTVMADQATSGGERLVQATPCWDTSEELASHHKYLADREQRAARDERRAAETLVVTELAACRGLPAAELEHSPFSHRRAIAQVIPHRDAGKLRGVRVIFKPVPGLTAAWMRQAIACHRARFERLGEPATYLPEDPSLVARATTQVELRHGHLEVTIEVADDVQAAVALDRAEDLVRARTAKR